MAEVVTVREAVARAKTEGYPVSEHTLRQWIKTGEIPVRKIGPKYLIYYPNLLRYLRCEDGADNEPEKAPAAGKIRPIRL